MSKSRNLGIFKNSKLSKTGKQWDLPQSYSVNGVKGTVVYGE